MTSWTDERKRTAAILAPQTRTLLFPDTRITARDGWYQVVSECNQPAKWCVGPWSRPLDLGERLRRRGFSASAVRGMGIATNSDLTVPSGVAVEEVTSATLDRYMRTLASGWGITTTDVDLKVFASSIEESPRVARHFMSFVNGGPAGTGALIDREDHGYLLARRRHPRDGINLRPHPRAHRLRDPLSLPGLRDGLGRSRSRRRCRVAHCVKMASVVSFFSKSSRTSAFGNVALWKPAT